MDQTPQQLRRHAEHCRDIADSQVDERVRLILQTMACEFDQQAAEQDSAEQKARLANV